MREQKPTEKAIAWMERIAADPAHGYDQTFRWGERGDYDCSSAVITAWQQAGVPVKPAGASYTGNMFEAFTRCGFKDVTKSVRLSDGQGLQRGDVLLNHRQHTAMYCGEGKTVEASINEHGRATGGKPGDQTGKEFLVRAYRNYPWDCVLRYPEDVPNLGTTDRLGSFVSQPASYWPPRLLLYGMRGEDVRVLQTLLRARGVILDADGDYGQRTRQAVQNWQQEQGLEADGIAGNATWTALLRR